MVKMTNIKKWLKCTNKHQIVSNSTKCNKVLYNVLNFASAPKWTKIYNHAQNVNKHTKIYKGMWNMLKCANNYHIMQNIPITCPSCKTWQIITMPTELYQNAPNFNKLCKMHPK